MIWLQKLWRGTIVAVLALLLAAVAAFAWIQTPPGKRQVASLIERAASDESLTLEIGTITGSLAVRGCG